MSWIEFISTSQAAGLLNKLYDQARKRAGNVANIVSIMSLNPPVLQASMGLYGAVMKGDSELSRSQREMLATIVSASNHCVY